MTSAPRPDAVVIGAGLVGALCALRLAEAGLRVVLIECGFAGGGSSGAAMGHLVVMDDSVPQRDLCALSLRRWDELFARLPGDAEHDRCGTLWLAPTTTRCALRTVVPMPIAPRRGAEVVMRLAPGWSRNCAVGRRCAAWPG